MGVLNFASVMAVLRGNISDAVWPGQVQFIEMLFSDYRKEMSSNASLDSGLISKWINNFENVSPYIVLYYRNTKGQRKLSNTIAEMILPMMAESAMAVQELNDLLWHASNVAPQTKKELSEGFSFEDEYDEAVFITSILCLAMQKPAEGKKQLQIPKNLSPTLEGYIFSAECPNPCKHFVGRADELEVLHSLLLDHTKVFLHGIPGIGKSELVKKYAKFHRKEYTNVIYLFYLEDLRKTILKMEFVDDQPGEDDETRFFHHSSFLRSLREDNLVIIDNFNVTAEQDPFLSELLKYRCRILFTTRCRYEDHISMELSELGQDVLLELAGKLFSEALKRQNVIIEIIRLLHSHTFAVELAARLLAKGILTSRALREKLKKEKAALDAEDKIRTTKDGRSRKATYYDHIHSLFSLYSLSDEQQEILRSLTLIPAGGIISRVFAGWMEQRNMNTINDLLDMGFIHPKNDWEVFMHPMIREVAIEELKPSVISCSVLLNSLQEISLRHGQEFMENRRVFHTVECIMETIKKDNQEKYLLFLKNMFQYMDKYRYVSGMRAVLDEMTVILSDKTMGTSADRAFILDCEVALEKNPLKQIELARMSVQALGIVDVSNAHLAANLHSNLGALYLNLGCLDLAQKHMEQGLGLLEKYDLNGYHDRVIQVLQYAVLLSCLGEYQKAYSTLENLSQEVKEMNSNQCLDYGLIQQKMGDICLETGDQKQALKHYVLAMDIFDLVFEDEPILLEEKRQEFRQVAQLFRLRGQELPV